MTQEPFDRHDWYVEDVNGGEPRRYVIDFYEGAEEKTKGGNLGLGGSDGNNNLNIDMMKPPSMYIDVRPALDNPSAAVDRVTMFARDALPGLASAWDTYRKNSSSSERVANVENTKSEDGAQQR
jgi:cytochrome c heme-lyase